jgi:hypothetical protein
MATGITRYLNVAARLEVFAPPLTVANLTGEGLTMEWEIQRTNTRAADTGTLRVYNLARTHRRALQQAQVLLPAFAYQLSFSLGWDGLAFEALRGPLTQLRAEERASNTDIITTFEWSDGLLSLRDASAATTPVTIANGLWLNIFEAIAATFPGVTGLAPSFETALAASPTLAVLPNFSAVLNNDPVNDMNDLVSSLGPGYDWGIQDSKIVLYNAGLVADTSPPFVLAANTGLISATIQGDGSVLVHALANAGVRPGQQVQVLAVDVLPGADLPVSEFIGGGPLRIESVSWSGSTVGESTMSLVTRRIELF